MDYQSAMMQTIKRIDNSLTSKITPELLAEEVGYSHYYFQRLFMATTGLGLMTYVRNRRLAYARKDVVDGRRLLDIALDYGYGSERAFTRAYQSYFGITPSASRDLTYAVPRPLWIGDIDMSVLKGRVNMRYFSDVFYKEVPTMSIVSMTRISEGPEEEVIAAMNAYMVEKGLPISKQYGFDVPVSDKDRQLDYRGYEFWSQVPDDYTDRSVEIKKIPGFKYATLTITDPFADPFDRIPGGWKTLVSWIEAQTLSGNAPRNAACLEEVYEKGGLMYMDIMIPVDVL